MRLFRSADCINFVPTYGGRAEMENNEWPGQTESFWLQKIKVGNSYSHPPAKSRIPSEQRPWQTVGLQLESGWYFQYRAHETAGHHCQRPAVLREMDSALGPVKRVRRGHGSRCQYPLPTIWPLTPCPPPHMPPPPHLQDVGHKRAYLLLYDRHEALANHVVHQAGQLSQLQQPGVCLLQLLLQLLALHPLKVYGASSCPDALAVFHSLLQALLHLICIFMNLPA